MTAVTAMVGANNKSFDNGNFETESCFSLEVTLGGSPDTFHSLQDWRSHKCSSTHHHHGGFSANWTPDIGSGQLGPGPNLPRSSWGGNQERNEVNIFWAFPDFKTNREFLGGVNCVEPEVAFPLPSQYIFFTKNLHQMIQLVASQRITSCRNSKDIFFSESCQTTYFTFFFQPHHNHISEWQISPWLRFTRVYKGQLHLF